MLLKAVYTLLLILLFFVMPYSVYANTISQHLSTVVIPEPIKRVPPSYPSRAAIEGREGWAILSFVINKQGVVEDVLVKSSSGSKDLTQAAKKAVKKWRYKPAMENGKAIQQCVNTVQLDFRMGERAKGASKRFAYKYNKARAALKAKDFATLETQIALMNKDKYMHLSENNYLHWLSADYAKEQGDKSTQLQHLSRVAMSLETLGNEEQQLSVLYQTFNLQIELNKFKAAYNTYEELLKLPAAKPYLSQFSDILAQVETIISGDENLIIDGDITKDFWSTALVRTEFSLTDIQGDLHTLDVRCANKRHVYTIETDNTWKLPASWENCSIYVYGAAQTSFKLIEHPLSI